jgi:hypothetical protein
VTHRTPIQSHVNNCVAVFWFSHQIQKFYILKGFVRWKNWLLSALVIKGPYDPWSRDHNVVSTHHKQIPSVEPYCLKRTDTWNSIISAFLASSFNLYTCPYKNTRFKSKLKIMTPSTFPNKKLLFVVINISNSKSHLQILVTIAQLYIWHTQKHY